MKELINNIKAKKQSMVKAIIQKATDNKGFTLSTETIIMILAILVIVAILVLPAANNMLDFGFEAMLDKFKEVINFIG